MVSGHHGVSGSVDQCPLRCVATGARPGKYTLIINMRYLYYLQCSPVSSLPTLHRAVCAAQCPAAGCCDCSPAPAASPCPRTRWGPGNSGPRAGRLASWYETGAGAPLVDRINYILFQPYTVGCIFTSVSTITCQATWHCKRRILQQ